MYLVYCIVDAIKGSAKLLRCSRITVIGRGIKDCKRFGMEERLNKFSDEQFLQPGICAEASQILLIAEQNLKFCSRPQRKTLRNGGKYDYH